MSDLQQLFGQQGGFDTNSVPPQEDFVALPPGKYPVIIDKAAIKATKTNTGHYLELTMTVLDGPPGLLSPGQYKNRKLWDRINIQNPSQQCVEIGLRCLAALGQAIGLANIKDTDQLVGGTVLAHVKVDKDNQNVIRTYSALTPAGAPDVPQVPFQRNTATATGPISQPVTSSGVKPPWAR